MTQIKAGVKKLPQTVRRRNSARITQVPAAGRPGPAPKWPYGVPTKARRERWKRLWAMPQAVIWESMDLIELVARLVLVEEEALDRLTAHHLAEVRQLEDRLLLNPVAMFRAQVQIVDESGQMTAENITDLEAYKEAVGA